MSRPITIARVPVEWDGNVMSYTAGMAVDADGSPRCYHPANIPGLDALGNSGWPNPKYYVHTLYCKGVKPVLQDGLSEAQPMGGFFISMTSYIFPEFKGDDVRRYVNAEEVPFVVVPPQLRTLVKPRVLGCRAVVTREGYDPVEAVVVDIGPKHKIGEGSVALARELGLNPDPRRGGTSKKIITYTIYPGVPAVVHGKEYKLR